MSTAREQILSTRVPDIDEESFSAPVSSQDLARAILDGVEDAIFVKDLSGRYLNVNAACLKWLGKREDELIGHDDTDLFPPDQVNEIMRIDHQVMDRGEVVRSEEHIKTADGPRIFLSTKTPYRNAVGQIIGVIGVYRDITEIRGQEALTREWLNVCADGLWDWNIDTNDEYMSPGFWKLFGYEPHEKRHHFSAWQDMINQDDLQEVLKTFKKHVETKGKHPYHQVVRYRHKDGHWVWVICRGKVVEWHPDGRAKRMIGTHTDITRLKNAEGTLRDHEEQLEKIVSERTLELEQANAYLVQEIEDRRKAEQSLREGESQLRALINGIDDGLFVHDLEGRILECNDAACRRLGYSREELLSMSTYDIDEPGFAKGFQERLTHQIKDGTHYSEGEHLTKDGRRIPVDILASRLEFRGNQAVLAVSRDITERKSAEDERRRFEHQVQHTQKLESLGVLAGGIAHDFNNLLMGILGNVEMSLEGVKGDSNLFEELTEIRKSARHAADLCRQMLAYSGKGQFVTESLCLSTVVRDISSLLEASVSKSCALQYDLLDDIPPVQADAVQMRQILLNLVTNASEAIDGQGGSIEVSTSVRNCDPKFFEGSFLDDPLNPGLYVVLEVKDTGAGMDAETVGKIFDPFFTTKFTGRGLGLAAVLGIIRGHKGTVRVKSASGQGTTFTLYFPASQKVVPSVDQDDPGRTVWGGGGMVLLVDDEPTVRVVGRRMLERAGFDVVTAEDGVVGVERLQEHKDSIVCVLLDLTMPKMDGEETYREMRKIRDDLPVIVSSGYDEQDVIGRFETSPNLVFLQKPYEKSALVSKIYELLDVEDAVHA